VLEQLFDFNLLNRAAQLSIPDILASLFVSFTIGLFIYFVYMRTYKGIMHAMSFGVSLVAVSMITTLIILAVSSNFAVSLGLVGALSIVRFRTVIKEALDLVYLFWSIATGVIVGMGAIPMALVGAIAIGMFLFFFANRKVNDTPYVVIISCDGEPAELQALALIEEQTKKHVVKAKSVSKSGIELTVEVRLKESCSKFVSALLNIEGVYNATMVSYNGDYYT